jgi:hypothetical protein
MDFVLEEVELFAVFRKGTAPIDPLPLLYVSYIGSRSAGWTYCVILERESTSHTVDDTEPPRAQVFSDDEIRVSNLI